MRQIKPIEIAIVEFAVEHHIQFHGFIDSYFAFPITGLPFDSNLTGIARV